MAFPRARHALILAVALAVASATLRAQQPIPRPKFEQQHASATVGNTGPAQGARFWLDFLKARGKLQAIRVCTHTDPQVIASIHFRYQTAGGKGAIASIGEGGTCAPEHIVPEGASLVGFSGVGGWYIDQFRFHFSDNSTTPTYGGVGGDHEFSITLRKKDDKYVGRLAGFFGTLDAGKLESLGMLYWAGT